MTDKISPIFEIITITSYDMSDSETVEYFREMTSYLDASFSFRSQTVKKCYCDNGIFYFTKDNQLKDSQICGNCKGKGYVGFDYDSKTGKYIQQGEQFD